VQYKNLAATAYECKSEWKERAENLEDGPLDVEIKELDKYSV
jgi:hypothetical protein